ncbi:MAG: peptidylprolyl isomerase [Alphaproteobacteria bacterium]|nr:peptidylprolyl isomerase [Alphaproteobacteria bacterium]
MSKMLRMTVLAVALSAAAWPVMAADKAEDKRAGGDPVVARVNGEEIHRSFIVRELQGMGAQAQQLPPQVLYPQLLQKAVITKLVSAKGYAQKLENDKEVKERLKDAEAQIVADVYVRRTVQPKISEEKIKERYEQLAGKYKPEDEVRARHILVPTEAEANDILKQIKDGADFAKLANEKSKDSGSAKQGGDLGYFTRSAMVKPFAEAAFGLKTGEMTDKPIKTDFGYHIIKVEDRRKSSAPPLSEVKDQITNQLGQEMVAQLVKDIESKAKVEKFNFDGTPMKAADKADKKAEDAKK